MEREAKRVKIFMEDVDQKDKGIVFCATQAHALAVRDLINRSKESQDPNYCQRVTADDGDLGDQYLREFQDNEKAIPTVLTTSQKLSTGLDARNVRNIVLMRPINSIIEFKQIIGRGTRLFEGKEYFTIYDFVDAYHHFSDPEWDGEPVEPEPGKPHETRDIIKPFNPPPTDPAEKRQIIKIKLADGKEREIQHMMSTSFWSAEGKPISAEQFLHNLFGKLPEFFTSEDELRDIWSSPITRKALLEKLAGAGFGKAELSTLQILINAEKSDLYDVLEYIAFAARPVTREARVERAKPYIFALLNNRQKDFLEFVLTKYIESGVEELDQEKLPELLTLKYQALEDALEILGSVENARSTFIGFQKHLYEKVGSNPY
jgi:type I restriction enzyme, R subunit